MRHKEATHPNKHIALLHDYGTQPVFATACPMPLYFAGVFLPQGCGMQWDVEDSEINHGR